MRFLSNCCFAYRNKSSDDNSPKKTSASRMKDTDRKEKSSKAEKSTFSTIKSPTHAAYKPKYIDCKDEHLLFRYPNFNRKSIAERYKFVSAHKLCKNCLRPNHLAKVCTMSACRKCGHKYSTKLYRDAAADDAANTTYLSAQSAVMSISTSQKSNQICRCCLVLLFEYGFLMIVTY